MTHLHDEMGVGGGVVAYGGCVSVRHFDTLELHWDYLEMNSSRHYGVDVGPLLLEAGCRKAGRQENGAVDACFGWP
jgi:hypothetical protein